MEPYRYGFTLFSDALRSLFKLKVDDYMIRKFTCLKRFHQGVGCFSIGCAHDFFSITYDKWPAYGLRLGWKRTYSRRRYPIDLLGSVRARRPSFQLRNQRSALRLFHRRYRNRNYSYKNHAGSSPKDFSGQVDRRRHEISIYHGDSVTDIQMLGGPGQNRTDDARLFRPALYH